MTTTYPTIDEALAVPATDRPGPLLVRYVKMGNYEWLTDLDVDEMLSYGYDDEFELVDVEEDASANADDAYAGMRWSGRIPENMRSMPPLVDTSEWDDPDNG